MMIDDFKQSVSGVGSKLDSTIARFDERVTKLEDKQEADIKAVQKELSSIKGILPRPSCCGRIFSGA